MKRLVLALLVIFYAAAGYCQAQYINPEGKTIAERFLAPKGYLRHKADSSSFAYFLQNLPLKAHGTLVKTYNGSVKPNRSIYIGVIDLEIGKENLQQCADAVIRLRAEYLYKQKRYSGIHFNLTNGFNVEYSRWKEGYRVKVNGNKTTWVKAAKPSNDYQTFRKYLDFVFAYAGTLSLSKELTKAHITDLQIGDILIQGGSPGHAVIVVDMAYNAKTKEKIYLLAQSYMPAQDIHVLQNPSTTNGSPWYSFTTHNAEIPTPEWLFYYTDAKRFSEE